MLTKKFFKTKNEAEITFDYNGDDVTSVSLVAEFNDWEPIVMKYNKKLDVFRTKVKLPKEKTYSFRYLVNDSVWENDPQADQYSSNEYGSENSVVSTLA
jgi:1,4-alpha-glucan branching enzyme